MAAYTYRDLDGEAQRAKLLDVANPRMHGEPTLSQLAGVDANAAGNVSDLKYQIQELNTQLRDRKQQNVMLSTENARLNRLLYDLQQRLSDIEMGRDTKRGEASTMGALRLVAAQTKQKQLELSKNFEEALAAYQVVADQNTQLEGVLGDTTRKLEAAEAGWKAAREEVSALQEQTDAQEAELIKLRDSLAAVQQQCGELKQALSAEQQARVASEAHASELSQALDKERKEGADSLGSLSSLKSEHAALQASFSQQEQGLRAQVAERDAAIQDLTGGLERLKAVAATALAPHPGSSEVNGQPGSLVVGHLLGAAGQSAAQPATAGAAQGSQAASIKDSAPLQPSAPASASTLLSPDINALEICLHDITLTPAGAGAGPATTTSSSSSSNKWSLVQLDTPGLQGRARVALITDPSQSTVPLNQTYQLRFPGSCAPGGAGTSAAESALAVIAAGQASLAVHDLSRSLVGGLRCPAPAGHPQAGQVLPLLAVAHEHAPNVNALELMVLDAERGVPSASLGLLSVDWSRGGVLPAGALAPSLDEFLVELRGHDPLVLEAARMSGLFIPGRTITGPGGVVYQVWGLSDPVTRRSATKRFLDREFEVCPDLASTARPVATASLPLTAALTAPPLSRVTARLMHAALQQDLKAPGAYEPAPEHGSRAVTLSDSLQRPAGSATVTVRLLNELALAQTIVLRGVQQGPSEGPGSSSVASMAHSAPSREVQESSSRAVAASGGPLTAGQVVSAPPLPPGHWAAAMAAEYVTVARLASQLGSHLAQACARLLGGLAVEARDLDDCQQATLNCLDLITQAQQQLSGCSASCAAIAEKAASSGSADSWLAPAFARHVQAMALRSLAQPLLLVHQRLANSALAAGLSSQVMPPANPALVTSGPMAAPVPGPQQRTMAASLHSALLSAYSHLLTSKLGAQAKARLVQVLAAAAGDVLAPHMRALPGTGPVSAPPPEATCMPGQRPPAVVPTGGNTATSSSTTAGVESTHSIADALDTLVSNLQAAVDMASAQGSEVVEQCRKNLALPPPPAPGGGEAAVSGEAALVGRAQQLLSAALTPATAALLEGLTLISQSALAQLLSDPSALAMLRGILNPSAASQPVDGVGAGGYSGPAAALQNLQVRVASVLVRVSKCDPLTSPPATPPSAPSWFRAAHFLKVQLSGAYSFWVATTALTAGTALLLGGQMAQGVGVMMDALAAEATRVIQLVQSMLSDLRMSRLFEETVIQQSLPAVAALLGAHLVQAARLVFDQPLQLLMTPLRPRSHLTHQVTPWSGPPVLVAGCSTVQLLAPWGMPGLPGEGYGSDSGIGDGAGGLTTTGAGVVSAPQQQTALAKQQEEWLEGGGSGEPALVSWRPRGAVLLLVPEAVAAASGPAVSALKAAAAALGWAAHTWPEFGASPGMGCLPESQVVAEAAARMDAVIPLAPSQELGSLVQWFRKQGVAVLQPEVDPDLHTAVAEAAAAATAGTAQAAAAGVSSLTGDTPVQALARALVARVTLQSLYNRTGAAATSGSPSSDGMPLPPIRPHELAAAVAATGAVTHIPDAGAPKPLIAQARSLHQRLRSTLSSVSSSLSNSALLQPHVAHMVSSAEVVLQQSELLLEGALSAPAAAVSSAATAAEAAHQQAEAAAAQRAALAAAQAGQQPQLGRNDSLNATPTRRGLALPAMPSRGSAATPPAASGGGAATASPAGAPGAPAGHAQPYLQGVFPAQGHGGDDDGASTASEDYEPHVAPVGVVPGVSGPGLLGVRGAGGARVDGGESELESDAASVASASTQHGYRGGRHW